MSLKIAPSLLAADAKALGEELKAADKAGGDWMHLDIMDAHFVPNLSFGPAVVKALRSQSRKPFDVHLMLSRPTEYLKPFALAGADAISWHLECDEKPKAMLSAMKAFPKLLKGLAIKPKTSLQGLKPWLQELDFVVLMSVEPGFGGQRFMPEILPKLRELKAWRGAKGLSFEIEMDGGIDERSAPLAIAAGAEILVAGSSVFSKPNYRKAIQALRKVKH